MEQKEDGIILSFAQSFEDYLFQTNKPGSNKAASYLRAIELLSPILKAKGGDFREDHDVLTIDNPERIRSLYQFILEQQKLGEDGIFNGESPSSYWRDRYFSAALNQYYRFLKLPEQAVVRRATQMFQDLANPTLIEKIQHLDDESEFERFLSFSGIDESIPGGIERIRMQKTRVNQSIFRKITLLNYQNTCCITGLTLRPVLRASHILAWSESVEHRMNPANGLCLSATYDAAFDRHLISLDEEYRIILSKKVRENHSNEATRTLFLSLEGTKISLPKRFQPNQDFLKEHRERMG